MCNEKCVHGPCFKLLFTFSEIRGRTSPAISTDWLHSVALSNPDLKMPATRGLSLRPKGDPYCEKLFQNWRALIGRQFQTETGHRRSSESRNTTAKSASGEVCNLQQTSQATRRPALTCFQSCFPSDLPTPTGCACTYLDVLR